MNNLVLIFAFIIIFLGLYWVGISMTAQEKNKKRRVSKLTESEDSFIALQETYSQEKSARAILLEALAKPFSGNKDLEQLKLKLHQCGYTSPDAVSNYLFCSAYGWVAGLFVGLILFKVGYGQEGAIKYAYYFLAILLGMGLTFSAKLVTDGGKQKRNKLLINQFPDALDLLLICVESGLALDAAMARVCKELKYVHPEITDELNITRLELTMLNDRGQALQNLADRVDIMSIKSLVAALLQSEKFGTSLVDTLRVLSDDFRQTRLMQAEEKAAKLDPKITAVTIPFMLIALLILILSPAVLEATKKLPASKTEQGK